MRVLIKGAGDIASGIAMRLHRAHMEVAMTELAEPTAVRRTVCFSEAVRLGGMQVEEVPAALARSPAHAVALMQEKTIPVLVDEGCASIGALAPDALVDAILAKRNLHTTIADARIVIGVGPGFAAGADCHAVIETQRGHLLGRALYQGSAAPNSGVPGEINGYTLERLLRAPVAGVFQGILRIGAQVRAGDIAATVGGEPVVCRIGGVLRGLLPSGIPVQAGMKCGDVDPRCEAAHCHTVSDKALAVAGGVLEALLHLSGG